MSRLIEPVLYLIGFALATKLLFKLKHAIIVMLAVVSNDISIGDRLYLIGLILAWIVLAAIAVLIIKNATRIGLRFMNKSKK